LKRTDMAASKCPVARTVDLIGEWWSLLILRDALAGTTRFNDFQQSLGIAKNILTVRLRKLVEKEVFELVPALDGGTYQEYRLTEKGKSLYVVLVALRQG